MNHSNFRLRILHGLLMAGLGSCTTFPAFAQNHCPETAAFKSAYATEEPMSVQTASQLTDGLLAALAQPHDNDCDYLIRQALSFTLPILDRRGEAAAIMDEGVDRATNYGMKSSLANYAVSLRYYGPTPLSISDRAACRAVSIAGLANAPSVATLLAAEDFGEIGSQLPLRHVVASTEGDSVARIQSLRALIEMCNTVHAAAVGAGEPSPAALSHFNIVLDLLPLLLDTHPETSMSDVVTLARTLDAAGDPKDAKIALGKVMSRPTCSPAQQDEILSLAGDTFTEIDRITFRYNRISKDFRAAGPAITADSARELLVRLDQLWADLQAIELGATPGMPAPADFPGTQWEGMVRFTLQSQGKLGVGVLNDCAYAPQAREFIARYAHRNITQGMETMVNKRCP